MRSRNRLSLLVFVAFLMIFNTIMVTTAPSTLDNSVSSEQLYNHQEERSTTQPFTTQQTFITSEQGWTSWSGTSSGLFTQEYGNRTDLFDDNQMRYFQSNGSTTDTTVTVPFGTGWEGHELFVELTDLTENRTWVQDPDLEDDPASWSYDNYPSAGGASASWLNNGHGVGDDCIEFEIPGDPTEFERAWAEQTFTVNRGNVVWAGFRLDYWIDSAWGADGFVAIFVTI
jgi:hypothetical protein